MTEVSIGDIDRKREKELLDHWFGSVTYNTDYGPDEIPPIDQSDNDE